MKFSAPPDWLLKLGIPSVIKLPTFFWKKGLLRAFYPLFWYILRQSFISVSVRSCGYLPRRFAARQISTTVHLHFGE